MTQRHHTRRAVPPGWVLPPADPGFVWVQGRCLAIGDRFTKWIAMKVGAAVHLHGDTLRGKNALGDFVGSGVWSPSDYYWYHVAGAADRNHSQGIDTGLWNGGELPTKRAIPEFPHTCPRCNQPAYVGLFEVAHATTTTCPARSK